MPLNSMRNYAYSTVLNSSTAYTTSQDTNSHAANLFPTSTMPPYHNGLKSTHNPTRQDLTRHEARAHTAHTLSNPLPHIYRTLNTLFHISNGLQPSVPAVFIGAVRVCVHARVFMRGATPRCRARQRSTP